MCPGGRRLHALGQWLQLDNLTARKSAKEEVSRTEERTGPPPPRIPGARAHEESLGLDRRSPTPGHRRLHERASPAPLATAPRSEHRSRNNRTGRGRSGRPAAGLPQRLTGILDPSGWTADTAHRYQALGPGKEITGVSFTIPAALAEGTNLSAGSYLSVEAIPHTDCCAADLFLPQGTTLDDEILTGTPYSVGHLTDAAVGNRYDETVYAIPGSDPCLAVRYFTHWTVLENYPAGVVTAFAMDSLLGRLDAIRRTLVVMR